MIGRLLRGGIAGGRGKKFWLDVIGKNNKMIVIDVDLTPQGLGLFEMISQLLIFYTCQTITLWPRLH